MKKEIITICIIIILIVIAHAVTQIYTQNFFDSISEDLSIVEEKMLSEVDDKNVVYDVKNDKDDSDDKTSEKTINKAEIEDDIKNVEKKWREKYNYFANFVEHDELEKVETQLISIKANAGVGNFDKCVDEIEKCKFIIKHIEEKDSLKIVNIF